MKTELGFLSWANVWTDPGDSPLELLAEVQRDFQSKIGVDSACIGIEFYRPLGGRREYAALVAGVSSGADGFVLSPEPMQPFSHPEINEQLEIGCGEQIRLAVQLWNQKMAVSDKKMVNRGVHILSTIESPTGTSVNLFLMLLEVIAHVLIESGSFDSSALHMLKRYVGGGS